MIDFKIENIFTDHTKCRVCNNKLKLHLDNTGVSTVCSKCGTVDSKFETPIMFIRLLGGN